MTSARAPRNTAQPGDRYGVTSLCLGNDHDISVAGSCLYEKKKTYPLQTCYEHNMLSSLHAVCLKVLVFFLWTEKCDTQIFGWKSVTCGDVCYVTIDLRFFCGAMVGDKTALRL